MRASLNPNASRTVGRAESCEGKKRFTQWSAAAFAAKNIRRHRDAAVHPYSCRKCRGFHVGENLR